MDHQRSSRSSIRAIAARNAATSASSSPSRTATVVCKPSALEAWTSVPEFACLKVVSTGPPSKCAYRASREPGCRGNTTTNGLRYCTAAASSDGAEESRASVLSTASSPSKLYSLSDLWRSSPGVCGPRKNRRHNTAVSSRLRFNTVRTRCSYLGTRLSRTTAVSPASSRACSDWRTSSSARSSTGSRLDLWLHAAISAFSDSGYVSGVMISFSINEPRTRVWTGSSVMYSECHSRTKVARRAAPFDNILTQTGE